MGIALEIVQGTSRDFVFQLPFSGSTDPFAQDYNQTTLIQGAPGNVITNIFTNTDTLIAKLWAGGSEVSLAAPAATWLSASKGQVEISFANTDTSSLTLAQYYLQAFVTRPGTPSRMVAILPFGTTLEVQATPGTDTPRPSYIVLNDILKIAPWVQDLQAPAYNTGFDSQLADSRDWVDEIVLRNYRGGNVSLLGYHGFALDAWYTGGGRRTSLTNRWLKDAIRTNKLLITARVKNICAYYALSRICESYITKSNAYVSLAARYRFEAESLLASTTLEIDVNGDGYGEVPINMSSTNTLWA